uniref:uncharacterized protein LOC107426928 isoform X1 n=1 Tax=Ziziphus jujuba TaxID=326968 RepID=A0A6P4ACI2_ZIZJJ
MVCSLGSGRMAVMARLLAAKSFSPSITEEVGHQKLAAQSICRELSEADEANLLDEEDMHVFGLKPMDDPLHLVCCNACKKPVKASQYAAHAELCRTLNSIEENNLGLDGCIRHRKPTKKERKKLLTAYANKATSVVELERSESIDANDTGVSQSKLDGLLGKRNSAYVDTKYLMDGSGLSPGNTDHSACVMAPPTKRSKLIAGGWLPLSDDIETVAAVSKVTSSQDTCRDSLKGTVSVSNTPNDQVFVCKTSGKVDECCLPLEDIPFPLASKVYYSQRSNRLRSALCRLYCESVASTKQLFSDPVNSEMLNETMIPSQASSQKNSPLKQRNNLLNNKQDSLSMPSMRKPDQFLVQSSEVCLGTSGGCQPPGDFSKQFPADNVPRPQVTPASLTRNKYLPKPFSGQSLGTVQQQNGSVPVI